MGKMGYEIEFERRTAPFFKNQPGDNWTAARKAYTTIAGLSKMLRDDSFLIFNAELVDDISEHAEILM